MRQQPTAASTRASQQRTISSQRHRESLLGRMPLAPGDICWGLRPIDPPGNGSLLQTINEPPNPGARVSAFGRATLLVQPVESLGFLLGFRTSLNQLRDRLFDKGLAIYQTQISTTPLNRMAVDVRRLRLYVKHEPDLKARIRGSCPYPAVTSLSDSPFKVGMLVAGQRRTRSRRTGRPRVPSDSARPRPELAERAPLASSRLTPDPAMMSKYFGSVTLPSV